MNRVRSSRAHSARKVARRSAFGQLSAPTFLWVALAAACGGGSSSDPGDTDGTNPATASSPSDGKEQAASNAASEGGSASGSAAAGNAGGEEPLGMQPQFSRLTRAEYSRTVQGALDAAPDLRALPEDGRVGSFTSNATVTQDPVHPYLLAAEELATTLVPDVLPACESNAAEACFEDNYRTPIERLYRRPLTDAEVRRWEQLRFEAERVGATPVEASRAMLEAALVSPDFLYRSVPWSDRENARTERIAEWLSYTLWDAPPDAELRRETLRSRSASDLQGWAMNMAEDPRAIRILSRFLAQWLRVDTDLREEEPGFESSGSFLELLSFVQEAVRDQLPVTDFIASRRGFVHSENAPAYGMDAQELTDSEVSAVDWPKSSGRRGLLAQELMAGSTRHPDSSRRKIFRGLLVRRSLLCSDIPAPTPELIALAGEVSDRTQDPRCQSCHERMDPIGQAFAAFDSDVEDPQLIQPALVLHHEELEGSYEDVGELLLAISESRSFAECFARHWLSFFLEQPLAEVDPNWSAALADSVQAGASLSTLVGETVEQVATTPLLFCEATE